LPRETMLSVEWLGLLDIRARWLQKYITACR
jgi:hypothetical protein